MSTIKVKPAHPDLKVRNPDNGMRHLAVAGEDVPQSEYWIRRLRDGDVVEVTSAPLSTGEPKHKAK